MFATSAMLFTCMLATYVGYVVLCDSYINVCYVCYFGYIVHLYVSYVYIVATSAIRTAHATISDPIKT